MALQGPRDLSDTRTKKGTEKPRKRLDVGKAGAFVRTNRNAMGGRLWPRADERGRGSLGQAVSTRQPLAHVVASRFGEAVSKCVGPIWGFDDKTQELRNMWTRTPQPGLWFTGGAFSQCRIYSRYIALQIDAIEAGKLAK